MNTDAFTLDDPRALDPTAVGNKAAGLARLRVTGFDVPDAIVLPAGFDAEWSDGPAPSRVQEIVGEAYAAFGPRLAVRSSATWEDGQTSAHAGATATVLDVRGQDAALAAVRHCLDASAVAQRTRSARGGVAIILQRLVEPDHAGVAFTADPVTGDREVVRVAATRGLGEALVQGTVVGSDITIRGNAVEGDLAGLDIDHARRIAEVARAVEISFGQPQDLEWAIADGHLHLLQARPITVLPVAPHFPEGNNWQKDVAHYPEPLTPFGWSVIHACEAEVHSVFDEMGLLVRGLEEVFVGGEIYGRVLPAFGSANDARKPPPAIVLGIAARAVPALRRRAAAARRAIDSDLAQRWAADWHATDRADMAQRADLLRQVDLAQLDETAFVDHLDSCMALTRRGVRIHFRLVMPLFHALYRLHSLVSEHLGWDDATTAAMLAGHSPATRAAEEFMARLRSEVRNTPGAVDALRAAPHRPIDALRDLDGDLSDALASWIGEHGWAMVNYDAGVPVLAERPTMITRLLLTESLEPTFEAADDVASTARDLLPAARRAEFDVALRDARAIYPVREDNTIIVGDRPLALVRRWMLEAADRLVAQGAIASPGDAVYLEVGELRSAVTGTDRDDLMARVVRRRGEEAWVRANPGPHHLGDQGSPPDISRLPRALRQVNEPVLWGIAHEYPKPAEPPTDVAILLAGVAASAGVAQGRVRIIRSHHEMDRLEQGDVLVCRVTSPSWAPLFPLAAAIVADGGGVLSHAAIAAREHGLPAVLGTATATADLRDGQLVRVDGTRGLVVEAVDEPSTASSLS